MNEKDRRFCRALGRREPTVFWIFWKEFCFTVFRLWQGGKAIALCSVPLFQFDTDAVVFCFVQNIFFLIKEVGQKHHRAGQQGHAQQKSGALQRGRAGEHAGN